MKRAITTGILAGTLLVGGLCRAAPRDEDHPQALLDYAAAPDVAASCPDRETFVASIATRLGYDPFGSPPASDPRTLRVRFRRDRAAVVVELHLARGPDSTGKSLVSETGACDELGLAAAFAAAILIDPRAMFPAPPAPVVVPRAAVQAGSGEPPSPGAWPWYEPPPFPPPPAMRPAPPEPIRWSLGLAAAGCAGCGPTATVGAGLFGGVSKGRLGLDVGGRADLQSAVTSAAETVTSHLVVGEVFPHARLGLARIGLLGTVGALTGESRGDAKVSVWAATGARVGVVWKLASPVFVRGALDAEVLLGRVSLRVAGREVWSSPALVAGLSLGGGVEF